MLVDVIKDIELKLSHIVGRLNRIDDRRGRQFEVEACADCVLFFEQGTVPPSRPDLGHLLFEKYPAHEIAVSDEDPDLWSPLPCGTCLSTAYGCRQTLKIRRCS